jgi:heavy metal translocating P-type ATPase
MLLFDVFIVGGILYGITAYKKNKKATIPLIKKFNPQRKKLFFEDMRSQQLQEISSTTLATEISEVEKKNNQNLVISLVSLGLTTAGALVSRTFTLIAIPALIYTSIPFYKEAYKSLFKERKIKIAVADVIIVTGCLASGYFFAASLAGSFYFGSRKLLLKAEEQSNQSVINIFGKQPRYVWILSDESEIKMPLESLKINDIVIVNAGETIPIDGFITLGVASIDQHILTGESQPEEKGISDQVFASTVVLSGKIYIQVDKLGSDTVAAQIGDILSRTSDYKSSIQLQWMEKVDKSTLPVLIFSAITFLILGPVSAVTVMNANFAYNMRVLAPISMLNFLNLASLHGVLIKDGRSLELLNQVDTIVFDKTGTLTLSQPHVGQIDTCHGYEENELLKYAAAAEYKQTHPIALAILNEAKTRELSLPDISEAQYEIGYGIKVNISNQLIRVGSARFIEMEGITIPAEIRKRQKSCHKQGYSLVMVAIDDRLGGAIELQATIRPEAKRIINTLRQRNISIYIISGDHEQSTKKLAKELNIDNFFAEVLPENKAKIISELQNQGKLVCFVGDGINDSIALKKANVSISLRGASSIATDTAQIILMDKTLNQLIQLFELAKNFNVNMNNTLITTIIPGIVTINGVFFLHFGMTSSIVLNEMGFVAGMYNVMLPLLKNDK